MQGVSLLDSLSLACSWMTDIAQVMDAGEITEAHRRRHMHEHWVGALKGEYRHRDAKWAFFCPVWHTGQALKALVMASEHLGDGLLTSARLEADFLWTTR